jgi:hypothetical protein
MSTLRTVRHVGKLGLTGILACPQEQRSDANRSIYDRLSLLRRDVDHVGPGRYPPTAGLAAAKKRGVKLDHTRAG